MKCEITIESKRFDNCVHVFFIWIFIRSFWSNGKKFSLLKLYAALFDGDACTFQNVVNLLRTGYVIVCYSSKVCVCVGVVLFFSWGEELHETQRIHIHTYTPNSNKPKPEQHT